MLKQNVILFATFFLLTNSAYASGKCEELNPCSRAQLGDNNVVCSSGTNGINYVCEEKEPNVFCWTPAGGVTCD